MLKNNGKLEITQGQARNLTGNLEVQVIGHGEQVDGINKLEGLNSDAVVEIIQRFIPQAAELTTIFLMSCYSDSCLNGKSSLQQRLCQWCIVCFVWLLFSFACRWQFDHLLFG
jgi:hypothetical protein